MAIPFTNEGSEGSASSVAGINAYSGRRTSTLLARALWTTQGEITRGIGGIGTADLNAISLTVKKGLERWSRDVRARLYASELLADLHFDARSRDFAELFKLNAAFPATPGGALAIAPTTVAKLHRPRYDYRPDSGAPGTAPGADLETELKRVFELAALRADRMGEILSQVTIPYPFFAMVLNLQPGRHRHIYELLAAAFNLASAAGQVFKHHFRVARPADRTPLIQPVLQTPGHGAYPAGHATQCHIAKTVLAKLLGTGAEATDQLEKLANRIGENRIVAGLHYPSDIDQGKVLGEALGKHFIEMAKVPGSALEWLWGEALAEK